MFVSVFAVLTIFKFLILSLKNVDNFSKMLTILTIFDNKILTVLIISKKLTIFDNFDN